MTQQWVYVELDADELEAQAGQRSHVLGLQIAVDDGAPHWENEPPPCRQLVHCRRHGQLDCCREAWGYGYGPMPAPKVQPAPAELRARLRAEADAIAAKHLERADAWLTRRAGR